jgi:cellulose synthase/poly-beta-1,6-N-acetylglucosamine synthase-like glycosyltransferase
MSRQQVEPGPPDVVHPEVLDVAATIRRQADALEVPVSPLMSAEHLRDEKGRVAYSANGLRVTSPQLSAGWTLTPGQRSGLIAAAVLLLAGLIVSLKFVLILIMSLIILIYSGAVLIRIALFRLALKHEGMIDITDEEALSVPDSALPIYTVLVPAFMETEVFEHLVASLRSFQYPADRLDIKLLLEENDTETIEAARRVVHEDNIEIVLVPSIGPQTKPKALNYGLTLARGDIVAVYDAEDRPDPLQLRRAALALARSPKEVVCIQAKLSYFNPHQNFITRCFSIEYDMWFSQLLPGLAKLDAPIPLGGTSNHFRRQVLVQLGAWDPYNVTEDADLGLRLHRLGYRTGMIESTTFEEANSDFVNWVKQRSRWYKGYLQTWLVHLRHPLKLWRQLGPLGFVIFNLFVGGTPMIAILNPLFWAMTLLWFVGQPHLIQQIFPAGVYHLGMACWLGGNFFFAYIAMLRALRYDRSDLMMAAILSPVYWVMMSVAATKALVQIINAPSYWEKTQHGLDLLTKAQPGAAASQAT